MKKELEDMVYEFYKLTAKISKPGWFNLPDISKGSSYREVYSVSELRNVDPSVILLIQNGEPSAVKNHVRLIDMGFEILHPAVLLNLLRSCKIPEEWKGKHIDFIGAWFCALGDWKHNNNPMTISVFWHDGFWDISYDDLNYSRENHCTAVIKKG